VKILVLSLLRTGDLFMHGQLVQKIHESYPESEIHILVNDLNIKAVELISGVNKVHILNRSYLQKNLVEENRPWIRAHQNLRHLIQNLNLEGYDLVYNLTHNFFSARLMDAISAKEKRGVRFQNGQAVPMSNSWAEYCNTQFSLSTQSQFHYIQILASSLGIEYPILSEKKSDQPSNRICLQVLTSDSKKNWSFVSFKNLIELLFKKYPHSVLTILGAPDEKKRIEDFFSGLDGVEMLFPQWSELPALFRQTQLLITGDTSIQHLAVQSGVPVLSLFLGSANPLKTGPYQDGAIILQSRVSCTPCSHSRPCSKPTHLCEQDILPTDVLMACDFILKGTSPAGLSSRIFQVRRGVFGQYSLQQFFKEDSMEIFEQIVWQIYLDGGFKEIVGPYGTSARFFQNQSLNWVEKKSEENLGDKMLIEEIEQRVLRAASNMNYDESAFQIVVRDCKEILKAYNASRENVRDYFFCLEVALEEQVSLFPLLRKIKSGIQEAQTLLNIELKLIQTIKNEIKERGHEYVSGARKLFEVGSSQA